MHQVEVEYMIIGGSKRFPRCISIKDGLYSTIIKYRNRAPFFTQDQCQILESTIKVHNETIFYEAAYSLVGNILTESFYSNKLRVMIRYSNTESKTIQEVKIEKDYKDITLSVKEDFLHWPMLSESDIDFIKLKYS